MRTVRADAAETRARAARAASGRRSWRGLVLRPATALAAVAALAAGVIAGYALARRRPGPRVHRRHGCGRDAERRGRRDARARRRRRRDPPCRGDPRARQGPRLPDVGPATASHGARHQLPRPRRRRPPRPRSAIRSTAPRRSPSPRRPSKGETRPSDALVLTAPLQ